MHHRSQASCQWDVWMAWYIDVLYWCTILLTYWGAEDLIRRAFFESFIHQHDGRVADALALGPRFGSSLRNWVPLISILVKTAQDLCPTGDSFACKRSLSYESAFPRYVLKGVIPNFEPNLRHGLRLIWVATPCGFAVVEVVMIDGSSNWELL